MTRPLRVRGASIRQATTRRVVSALLDALLDRLETGPGAECPSGTGRADIDGAPTDVAWLTRVLGGDH